MWINTCVQGPDAPLMVSGREVSMITIVGCVEPQTSVEITSN